MAMLIDEEKLAYLCEIAFCMGANDYTISMNKILENYPNIDFDYDCYPYFYDYIYKVANEPKPYQSLLQDIYELINDRNDFDIVR